jgi:hypothetical protein
VLRHLVDALNNREDPPDTLRPAPTIVPDRPVFRDPDRLPAPAPAYLASQPSPDRRLASLEAVAIPAPAPSARRAPGRARTLPPRRMSSSPTRSAIWPPRSTTPPCGCFAMWRNESGISRTTVPSRARSVRL